MNSFYLFFFVSIASVAGFLVVDGIIIAYLAFKESMRRTWTFIAATVGLIVSTNLLKEALHIARPDNGLIETVGYAFPSGHAAGAIFLALCVSGLVGKLKKRARYAVYILCGIATLAIGFSRIGFGVHTPLQVAAGYLIGTFWAFVFMTTFRKP